MSDVNTMRAISQDGRSPVIEYYPGRQDRRKRGSEAHDLRVEMFEIDVVGGERLDDQTLRAFEKRRRLRGRGDRIDFSRQRRDQRQRKISADAIDARHHQPEHRSRTAGAGRTDEAPRRAREIQVEPALAQRLPAGGKAFAEPGIPRIHERVRHPPPQEIAVARQLSEQPYFHGPAPVSRTPSAAIVRCRITLHIQTAATCASQRGCPAR